MCSFLYHHQERECEIEMVSVLVCSAAIRKYHRLDDLNNRNLSFHCSGGWKTKIRVSAGLVSGDTFLPTLFPLLLFLLSVIPLAHIQIALLLVFFLGLLFVGLLL